jgi:hypothetical protein
MGEMGLEIVEVEYETIVEESEDFVKFRIGNVEIEISKTALVDYDYEGRLLLEREDAEALNLA